MNLSQRDKTLIWHPFTQEKTASLPYAIEKGEGAYLYAEDGRKFLDLISSWWVNLHGHAHPVIAKAIYDQACRLEHVIFAGFTHSPAVELCEEMRKFLPSDLTKFFFSDNGSTAVEAALKMAYQYWHNNGEDKRDVFLSFDGGYHGDTFGAMSVSKKSNYHNLFEKFFFKVETMPYPATFSGDGEVEHKEELSLNMLSDYLADHKDKIVAFILEPLVQGASGMRMCRPEFLQKFLQILRDNNILIIFDEVMTGFYRTGKMFALESLNFVPDILCLSKGITGGFLPLALTIVQEKIYESFLGDGYEKAFLHGHSYTANPLGCAAAIASLKLLQDKETIDRINTISLMQQQAAKIFKSKNARACGTILAFDVDNAEKIKIRAEENGYLIRPLKNTVYLLPPYCVTDEELGMVYEFLYNECN